MDGLADESVRGFANEVEGERPSELGEDQGSIAPLLAVVISLAALVSVGVASVGVSLQRQAHAQAAADAVALAVAGGGIDSAQQVAIANGVTITSTTRLDASGDAVHVVVVEFKGITSTAAATLVEPQLLVGEKQQGSLG